MPHPSPLAVHEAILPWYDREKRDLPWRRSLDPYRIWISEIMLQQTRVEAVIPYYERFLSNFPTLADLAVADDDRLLNLWAGLGYYSRARNLKAAAVQIMERFGGRVPTALEDLRTLKGIGPYTAAAIASIAFGAPVAAIDGNLERVFARLLALRENPKTAGRTRVAELGESLSALGRAGDLNQAFMDLSSKVCLPREPLCGDCPLADHCAARAEGSQRDIPARAERPAVIELKAEGLVLVTREELLLARRPTGQWLAGMWDIPWWIQEEGARHFDLHPGREFHSCTQKRTITKHRISFHVRGVRFTERPGTGYLEKLPAPAAEFRWVPLSELHGINLPRPSEKALGEFLSALT
jgi:A/G-specific adenine glycosylase